MLVHELITIKLTRTAGLQRNALCKILYSNYIIFEFGPQLAGSGPAGVSLLKKTNVGRVEVRLPLNEY